MPDRLVKIKSDITDLYSDIKDNKKAGKYISQSLDMMKVLAGKYHGVKIYDKSLANFKLRPLSEIKMK